MSIQPKLRFRDEDGSEYPLLKPVKVSDVAVSLDTKRIPLNSNERSIKKGNIPYYGANNIMDYINDYIFDEELVLLAEDGGYFDEWRNRPIAQYVTGKSWVNNHAHVLQAKNHYLPKYLFYSLVHKDVQMYINGGTRSKLNQVDMLKIPLTQPSLPEQKKIAAFLSALDENIELHKRKLELLRTQKAGYMQRIFSRELRFRDEEENEYPEWESVKLGDIVEFSKGGTLSKKDLSEEGSPCILYGDLYTRYSEFAQEIYGRTNIINKGRKVKKGTILIPSSGETSVDIARALYIDQDEVYVGGDLNILTVNNIFVNPYYLSWVLNSPSVKHTLSSKSQGSSVVHLYSNQIRSISVPVPLLEEQEKISVLLVNLSKGITSIERKIVSLLKLKSNYSRLLLG